MMIKLKTHNLKCERQYPINVFFKDTKVGEYYVDIIVEDKVIVELKAAESIVQEYEAQLLNYLRATNIEVGLLLSFGKNLKFVVNFLRTKTKNLLILVKSVLSVFHLLIERKKDEFY